MKEDVKADNQGPALLSSESLASLRFEHDYLASQALEKLLEMSSEDYTKGCPIPRTDLFTLLKHRHEEDSTLKLFWDATQHVPNWVDWSSIERGQRFFYRYALGNMLGFALQGFIGENVAAFGPAEVLTRTGGLSKRTLIKRVFETFQWVAEATESLQSIQPGGQGHASTIRVRLLHASVRRRIKHLANERPAYYNTEKLGHPINAYDSILTITFFCCNPVWVQLPKLGIQPQASEISDFVALYRYLSYLLGTPSEYFCSVSQAKDTMLAMLHRKDSPTESSKRIAQTFIDCITDCPPLFLSRGLVEAGCRHFNDSALCDQLGIMQPGWFDFLTFKAICSLIYMITLLQRASPFCDQHIVNVRITHQS